MSDLIPPPAEDDIILHACAPISHMPVPPLPSTKGECAECSQPVWVADEPNLPSVGTIVVVCIICAMRQVDAEGGYVMNLPGIDPFEVKPKDER